MMLNCLIVDQEPRALDLLEKYVGRTPFLQLRARSQSASDALKCVKVADMETNEGVDLIFWGLETSPLNDVTLSDILSEWGRGRMKVILTRALDEPVPNGTRSEILEQLFKPISYPRFLSASMKAYEWFVETKKEAHISKYKIKDRTLQQQKSIWVKDGYRQVNILFTDILYIEKVKESVRIRLINGKQVITQVTLKDLEKKLPKEEFIRVHRSHIVRLSEINVIEQGQIIFDQMQIPISNSYRDEFMQMLAQRAFVTPKLELEDYNSGLAVELDSSVGAQEISLLD